MTNLTLPEGCLAFFLDDTGHEAMPSGHPVYGLGGCAVMANDLDKDIRLPWRAIRASVTGSADRPLHAHQFGRIATKEQMQSVADFFHRQRFARIGAIVSKESKYDGAYQHADIVAAVLKGRILEILKWTLASSVAVIFEASDRANRTIVEAFGEMRLEEDGKPIPIDSYFMPKSAGDPALEVADFIVHSVGRQARQNMKERGVFAPDFKAIFHGQDRRLVSFMEVASAASESRQPQAKSR